MRDGIQSFTSADGRHRYQRVGWQDGRIVWRMWSSWSNSRGVIDWLIVKTATMPKGSTRADVVSKMKDSSTARPPTAPVAELLDRQID